MATKTVKNRRWTCRCKPHWDKQKGVLAFCGLIVKAFSRASRSQEAILDAFEELGWPPCIDDPLMVVHGKKAKQRLRRAIQKLNEGQKNRLLRFGGNGSGTGIRWWRIER